MPIRRITPLKSGEKPFDPSDPPEGQKCQTTDRGHKCRKKAFFFYLDRWRCYIHFVQLSTLRYQGGR